MNYLGIFDSKYPLMYYEIKEISAQHLRFYAHSSIILATKVTSMTGLIMCIYLFEIITIHMSCNLLFCYVTVKAEP